MKKGEILCSFPQELMINPFSSQVNMIFDSLEGITDRDNICIVIYICKEMQNPHSYFSHFFKFLPQGMDGFPYFFRDEEKKLLENSMVDKWLILWKEQLLSEYNQIIV